MMNGDSSAARVDDGPTDVVCDHALQAFVS